MIRNVFHHCIKATRSHSKPRSCLKGLAEHLDNSTQDRQLQKYIEECDELITPAKIGQVKGTKPYVEGEKIIVKASRGVQLSKGEFIQARDLLLLKFSIATGMRPGPLNNAVLADFHKAQEEQRNKLILVAKHKRSKDGPAMLAMPPDLQRQMDVYVTFTRPQFAKPGEQKLFIKDDGYGFKEATIRKRITAFFNKTGISNRSMTHMGLRKCFSSNLEELAEPEEANEVEKVMCHGKETRKRCYVRRRCTKIASKAMTTIAKMTSSLQPEPKQQVDDKVDKVVDDQVDKVVDEQGDKVVNEPVDEQPDDKIDEKVHEGEEKVDEQVDKQDSGSAEEEDHTEDDQNIIPPSSEAAVARPSGYGSLKSGPVKASPSKLTAEEERLINAHFATDLQIGLPLRLRQVRTKLFQHSKLVKFTTFVSLTTKIQKYLNYKMGKPTPAKKPPSAPQKQVTEKVDAWLEGLDDNNA